MTQSTQAAAITSKQSRLYSDNEPRFGDSATTTTSIIRPRNRRLISTEQELVSTTSRGSSPGASSRGVSPIPSKHPSRRGGNNGAHSTGSSLGASAAGRGSQKTGPANGGAWGSGWSSSWSTLQGLASSVLGDLGELVTDESDNSPRTGSLDRPKLRRKDNSTKKLYDLPHGAWGPVEQSKRTEAVVGAGSQAERDATLRTLKLTRVLEGHEELNASIDANGNYKRRTSMDEPTTRHEDEEGDALVYVHHVQKNDTMAGVILRYNCQPAVFRKANGFWPNDSIQTRKVVVLPVDACAIKGRPCDPSQDPNQGIDLLAPTPSLEDAPEVWPPRSETSAERSEETPWQHVRWVLLDSSPNAKPVEIARMPRKTLGFFPPRRRTSQATNSLASTPRGSYDFPHMSQSTSQSSVGDPMSSPMSTSSRRTSNLGRRPSQSTSGGYFPPVGPSTRSRRESVNDAADRLGWLRGPGGVGTLGKGVATPGPGKDALNTWAKKHIPGITIDNLPSSSILDSDAIPFGFRDELASIAESSYNSPARSGSVTPSGGMGIENAAAAIEGWVRRLAVKGPGTPRSGAGAGTSTPSGPGDLIELLDGAGSDDGRGFELSPGRGRVTSNPIGSTGREDLESVLRGRRTSSRTKGGKSD
ncbi:hypothetical protein CJF32_00001864 [Rutstroemia sp. NJR-2017a WRK4]|nr:hypothetical protein CJF32_00001864 [Rutstroemia sp. NJR-2017a WRK4]